MILNHINIKAILIFRAETRQREEDDLTEWEGPAVWTMSEIWRRKVMNEEGCEERR